MANKKKRIKRTQTQEKVTVLAKSSSFMAITNAKSIATWKTLPGEPDTFVFDRVVKL